MQSPDANFPKYITAMKMYTSNVGRALLPPLNIFHF